MFTVQDESKYYWRAVTTVYSQNFYQLTETDNHISYNFQWRNIEKKTVWSSWKKPNVFFFSNLPNIISTKQLFLPLCKLRFLQKVLDLRSVWKSKIQVLIYNLQTDAWSKLIQTRDKKSQKRHLFCLQRYEVSPYCWIF